MCLSGCLPQSMHSSLMQYCNLWQNGLSNDGDDVETVEGVDPIGNGFSFNVNVVENISESAVDFVVNSRIGSCHVICASKILVNAVLARLSKKLKVLTVTGDSSSQDQVSCAKAWLAGAHDFLVSTVVALIGNENQQ